MKARVIFTLLVMVLAVSVVMGAAGGRRFVNPIGPPTVPPSRYSSSGVAGGLSRFDTSGNQIITGNVASGKHFRGSVPYQGATSFQDQLGSTSLDSFLRRSVGGTSSGYTPYYSPSGTITTTRPGVTGAFRPGSSTIGSRAIPQSEIPVEGFTQDMGPKEQKGMELGTRTGELRFRPRTISPQELERLLIEGVGTGSQAKGIIREQNLGHMEQLRRDLEELRNRSPYLRESLIQREDKLELRSKGEPPQGPQHFVPPSLPQIEGLLKTPDKQIKTIQERADQTKTKTGTELLEQGQPDIFEQMEQEIESLRKSIEEMQSGAKSAKSVGEKKEPGKEEAKSLPETRVSGSGLQSDLLKSLRKSRDAVLDVPDTQEKAREFLLKDEEEGLLAGAGRGIRTEEGILERPTEIIERPAQLAGPDVSSKAKKIMWPHESFEAYAEDKFGRNIVAAEVYMQQGRYYRAADSYALAGIYKPGDPLAHIGRSHALFVAGEYMSSSLFLSRALEVAPELPTYSKSPDKVPADYVGFKVGLTAVIDDRDKLETRAADVEQWLKTSGAPELQLLLGYVYHQMGRDQRAKELINAASQKMPESAAVQALKRAIEGTTAGTRTTVK